MVSAVSGIVISNVSHWLSAVSLFLLVDELSLQGVRQSFSLAFISALLHICSPAGLFLAAPYSESLFSLLSMCGFLLYAKSYHARLPDGSASEHGLMLTSTVFFGLATVVRSNGILSGVVFLYDLLEVVCSLVLQGISWSSVSRAITIGLSGLLVGLGFALPQTLAYLEYCSAPITSERPLWCARSIPSIYSWVQEHYW